MYSRLCGHNPRPIRPLTVAALAVAAGLAMIALPGGVGAAPGDADISVTKADSPDPVARGALLTYSVQVANAGPLAATDVALTDTLDSKVEFVSATPSAGTCERKGRKVSCQLGTIAAGTGAAVTIVVRPRKPGTVTNTAAVASPDDNTPANNAAIATTTVVRATGPSCGGRVATIVGSAGDDTIAGTPKRDVIVSFGGDDTIRSFGGNDIVCSKSGEDVVRGGRGNDRLIGGTGDDKLAGKAGDDVLKGKRGRDRLRGRGGNDVLNGGKGRDSCKGGGGRDIEKRCP